MRDDVVDLGGWREPLLSFAVHTQGMPLQIKRSDALPARSVAPFCGSWSQVHRSSGMLRAPAALD
jgi:hypothetical protein